METDTNTNTTKCEIIYTGWEEAPHLCRTHNQPFHTEVHEDTTCSKA